MVSPRRVVATKSASCENAGCRNDAPWAARSSSLDFQLRLAPAGEGRPSARGHAAAARTVPALRLPADSHLAADFTSSVPRHDSLNLSSDQDDLPPRTLVTDSARSP